MLLILRGPAPVIATMFAITAATGAFLWRTLHPSADVVATTT